MFDCEATKTCFVLFKNGSDNYSYKIPLPKKLQIQNTGESLNIIIPLDIPSDLLPKLRVNDYFCLDITDDPETYFAGHEGSLGYYLFRLRLRNYKIKSTNPLILHTKFFGGSFILVNRPLQRPNRQFIGNGKTIMPLLGQKQKGSYGIVFGENWKVISLFDDGEKKYVCHQYLDQYCSRNTSEFQVKEFTDLQKARKEFERLYR